MVGHRRHAVVPGRGHRAGPAAQPRVRAARTATRSWWPRRGRRSTQLSGRASDPRRRRRPRRGRVRRPRGAVRRPRPAARRGDRRRAGRARRRVRVATTASAGSSTASASARARCRPQLPIWVGGSSKPALRRAAERGDGWLPQGTAGGRHGRRHRLRPHPPGRDARRRPDRARRAVRPAATSATRPGTRRAACGARPTRSPRYLRTYVDLGVDQIQVGFVSRSADELVRPDRRLRRRGRPARERLRSAMPEPTCPRRRCRVVDARRQGRPRVRHRAGHGPRHRAAARPPRRRRRARRPPHREVRGGRRRGASARSAARRSCALDITDADACEAAVARADRRARRPRHPRQQRLPRRRPQGASSTRPRGVAGDDGREPVGHARR